MRSSGRLAFGSFCLDLGNERLLQGAGDVTLTPKAFAVLAYLAERPDQLVTKDQLLDAVWPETHVSDAALKVVVYELRKALGDDAAAPRFIATAHRRGYRFIAAVTSRSAPESGAAAAPDTSGLVGRDEELERLHLTYLRCCAGERQIAFITGEGGIGKTALVDVFEADLRRAGVRCARGQCLEHHGSGEAYLPILEALGDLCRAEPDGELVGVMRRHAPSWLAQMPGLVDQAVVDERAGVASRESMQREMADALDVMTAAQPLVVILEDMHWSDVSSVDLLSRVAHRRAPSRLLVLATYRPVDVILSRHPLKSLKQRLDQQRLCMELRLPHFGATEVERYLQTRLGGRPTPPQLGATVLDRTGGNPLFVVTLVDDLFARRWLEIEGDAVRVTVPFERIRDEVPEGVRQMIEAQVERLPAAHAARLEAASVVGGEFPAAALAAALHQPLPAVEAFCEAEQSQSRYLEAHGVATLADGTVCGRYRFSHALYRDVFYQRIGRSRRGALHRSIGEWLEAQEASPAELARHFVEAADAGTADKAVEYLRRAAERAARLFAHAEAAQHYQAALGLLGAHPADDRREEACRLRIALGESLERSGAVAMADEVFESAAQLARDIDSAELFARAALGRGRGHHPVNAADPALIALLEEALARSGPQPSAVRACLLARLDTALSPIPGAHERRAPLAHEALDYAHQHGDPETLLLVVQYTRWAFNGRESPEQLRRTAETMGRLAATMPHTERALQFLLIRLTLLHEVGDVAAAAVELRRFETLADEAGVLWFQWFAQRLLAYRALEDGRFGDAERHMHDALRIGQRTDHPNVLPTFGAQRIALHLQRGLFAAIEPQLAAISERRPEQFTTRAAWAYARLQLGDEAGARRELAALAADDFGTIPRDSLWLMVLARLAETCAQLGDAPRARQLRALFEPHADRVIGAGGAFASMGHGSRYLALLAHACGEWEESARCFERAVAIHDRMGARPWLAQSLYEHGRLLLRWPRAGRAPAAARRRAAPHLARARALAQELGMEGLQAALNDLAGAARARPPRPR